VYTRLYCALTRQLSYIALRESVGEIVFSPFPFLLGTAEWYVAMCVSV
jgi:hypothetical protein